MHADLAPFRFCPGCGRADVLVLEHDKALRCPACGFRYFHNTAVAVVALLVVGEEILFTRRAHAPAAGLLDFPGGFVDPGESYEEATVREVAEELGLALAGDRLRYLFSRPNRYPFAGVTYRTADAWFGLRLPERPAIRCADDVADAFWARPADVDPGELAFDTVRGATALLAAADLEELVP